MNKRVIVFYGQMRNLQLCQRQSADRHDAGFTFAYDPDSELISLCFYSFMRYIVGSNSTLIKLKIIKLIFAVSSISTHVLSQFKE